MAPTVPAAALTALTLTALAVLPASAPPPAAAPPVAPGPAPPATVASPRAEHDGRFALPVDDPLVGRRFAAPAARWSAGHRGVDLTTPPGTPVRAPGPGTVSFAGTVVDRGVLTIQHPDGLRSSLEPVDGTIEVGTRVGANQVVGVVARPSGHCGLSSCLHWGVRDGEVYLDPLRLVAGSGPVVLLPGAG